MKSIRGLATAWTGIVQLRAFVYLKKPLEGMRSGSTGFKIFNAYHRFERSLCVVFSHSDA